MTEVEEFRLSDLIKRMDREFDSSFLSQEKDRRAAYAIGAYLNSGMYYQRTKLKTRGLLKKMRYLLDNLDRAKLLKVFAEVSQVLVAVSYVDDSRSLGNPFRERAEALLTDAEWNSSSEELFFAFMMGFDLFSREWGKKTEETTDEQDK